MGEASLGRSESLGKDSWAMPPGPPKAIDRQRHRPLSKSWKHGQVHAWRSQGCKLNESGSGWNINRTNVSQSLHHPGRGDAALICRKTSERSWSIEHCTNRHHVQYGALSWQRDKWAYALTELAFKQGALNRSPCSPDRGLNKGQPITGFDSSHRQPAIDNFGGRLTRKIKDRAWTLGTK